jgi:hypothetical protein
MHTSVHNYRWRSLAKGPGIYIPPNRADTHVGGRNEISESVLVAGGAGTRNPGAPAFNVRIDHGHTLDDLGR